ncbi:MAG: phage holin family protein [Gammaproteobacteria bacterium]
MFESLRRLLAQLLALLQVRVELLTSELSGEIRRAAVILVWAAVALLFGALTLLMVTVTILVALWEQHRVLAAALITLGFFSVAAVALWQIVRRVRGRKPLLAASLEELRRDRAAIDAAREDRHDLR